MDVLRFFSTEAQTFRALAPFVAMLLAIAVLPAVTPRLWHRASFRLGLAALLGGPALWLHSQASADAGAAFMWHVVHEYIDFIALLTSLYVIAGGVRIAHEASATPGRNVAWLGAGGLLASVLGTTGASMLLLPALLHANAKRRHAAHVVVFFIFIVSNCGGLLLPLGDPPLFLGFLRGVPFFWTLNLYKPWAAAMACLLIVFWGLDSFLQDPPPAPDVEAVPGAGRAATATGSGLRIQGWDNLGLLLVLLAGLAASASVALPAGATAAGMLGLAAVSWWRTPPARRLANGFSWEPVSEVATVFAGIFATMAPALALLQQVGGQLGLVTPRQFFWTTGLLSAVLDNAPTYLTFATLASATGHTDPQQLNMLAASPDGHLLLQAISVSAVFFGALTYIGNGPNMMVRALAQRQGVAMPSFGLYALCAAVVLLPLYWGVATLFLS